MGFSNRANSRYALLVFYYLKLALLYIGKKILRPVRTRDRLREKMLTVKQPISHSVSSRLSMIRWGDGESEIMLGGSIRYQIGSPELRNMLCQVLSNASLTGKYMLGLPNIQTNKYNKNILFRLRWQRVFSVVNRNARNFLGFDAFIFRQKVNESQTGMSYLVEVIADLPVLFVGPNSRALEIRNHLPQLVWVEVPEKNAFESLESALSKVRLNASKQDSVILVSAGPGGKVLCLQLALSGFYCIDVGNFSFS